MSTTIALLVLLAVLLGVATILPPAAAQTFPCPNNGSLLSAAYTVGSGFNALTGQSRQPIFDLFTPTENDTWWYPYGQRSPNTSSSSSASCAYRVPAGLTPLLPDIDTETKVVTEVYANYTDFAKAYQSWTYFGFDIDLYYIALGFQYNRELMQSKTKLANKTSVQGVSRYVHSLYQVTAKSWLIQPITQRFQDAVLSLEEDTPWQNCTSNNNNNTKSDLDGDDCWPTYKAFVCAYGTHVNVGGTFGGAVHVDTFVSNKYVKTTSYTETEEQMSFMFRYKAIQLEGGYSKDDIEKKISEAFRAASSTDMYLVGGTVPPFSDADPSAVLGEWRDSLRGNTAALLQGRLVHIADLLFAHPKRQANMRRFIKEYFGAQRLLSCQE